MIEIDIDRRLQIALHNFEAYYNIRPNRITIGYRLARELESQFYCHCIPNENRIIHTYCGIPVKIDYYNSDVLEVGFMEKYVLKAES
jgi:hypothetical protein